MKTLKLLKQFRTPGGIYSCSQSSHNALEALGVAQLEQEATQYAVDLGVSALNSASEELINALGELGLAEEATAAKEAVVASAQASMEAAVAALELAQAVSDAALSDFNAAEVENFELATALTDALDLHSFYEDAYADAMEQLGLAQLEQEATQYAADLAASTLNQASEELINALGAVGLAEEATAAKAAILDGANAGMDVAQSALDEAQYALDIANASFEDAYSAVESAQATLNSAQSYANPLMTASQDAQDYYYSLDSEVCTYTPEVPSVELTPYVPSGLTPYVPGCYAGGYYETITPAVPATAWVQRYVCLGLDVLVVVANNNSRNSSCYSLGSRSMYTGTTCLSWCQRHILHIFLQQLFVFKPR